MPDWIDRIRSRWWPRPISPLRRQVALLDATARQALELAVVLAKENCHVQVALPHLVVGLIELAPEVRELLRAHGVDPWATSQRARERLEFLTTKKEGFPFLGYEILATLQTATAGGTRSCDAGGLLNTILGVPTTRAAALELAPDLERIPHSDAGRS